MPTNLEPLDPLDTLMVAIDTSIGALVTARAILEQAIIQQATIAEQNQPAPPPAPPQTMGVAEAECAHDPEHLVQVPTMGAPAYSCPCGAILSELPGE
ncbi:hypothetical protein SALGADO_35 [Arthrobacter phage Salgado]|uniref:Uncharacterized protein n=2 Tax=Laroyevirus TaxID=1982086 RepID=A0A0U4JU41_9CAUD|nr:hypothetical protein KMD21_gp34 [Arthrobacter phage LiSara]YP_010082644.1 hypothetical protein KMD22_gp35 [Arthrobacter phage Salgado]ALY10203.1 hypothetical protein SALGADO_35 [Arthrobacter phage Salgado]ASR83618.1 hypothetical protein SEA_LISARA_34 [Arthrobacter phage LiSara]